MRRKRGITDDQVVALILGTAMVIALGFISYANYVSWVMATVPGWTP